MKVLRSLRLSARQLGAHRTRTALALLGIVIGVASVIAMVAVGNGARHEVVERIQEMGTDLIVVTPAQVGTTGGRGQVRGTATTLLPDDAWALREELALIADAAPWASRRMSVSAGGLTATTSVLGVSPEVVDILNVAAATGGFHGEREEVTAARTAVLGPTVARALFGGEPAEGRTLLIGRVPFVVIGVLRPRGADLSGTDQDDVVMIPLRTAHRRVLNQGWLGGIYLRARSGPEMAAAAEEARWLLRERHGLERSGTPDDFEIQTQAELIAVHREVGDTFTTLIAGMALVSLLVGGVGILAVMLMSVRERRREVGLRLSVGARRRDVRTQFLAEALMLGTGGGLAGVALGLGAAEAVALATDWAIRVDPVSVAASFTFALLVGVFFGVYPAHRAALLDPVEALRNS